MSIGDKLRESVNQSRGLTEKLSQKYREHLGEELVQKQDQLREREAELTEREKRLDEREAASKKFYRVPRRIIDVPVSVSVLAGIFFTYQYIQPSIKVFSSSGEVATSAEETPDSKSTSVPSYADCYAKGIAYYKEIGSYPNFSTGEDAETEVRQRCSRSNGLAFGR